MSEKTQIHLRYNGSAKTFNFAVGETVERFVTFDEAKVPLIIANMEAGDGDPQAGQRMAQIFRFLVDNAKKSPDGKWVSASSLPAADGQVSIDL